MANEFKLTGIYRSLPPVQFAIAIVTFSSITTTISALIR
jgi:hypothetical protein